MRLSNNSTRWFNSLMAAIFVMALFALGAKPAAAGGTTSVQIHLDHWANGTDANDTKKQWQDGNLNKTNSHYAEGNSVPTRFVMDNLKVGNAYTLTFQWLTSKTQSGQTNHAHDYLTTYNDGLPDAQATPGSGVPNPCLPRVQGNAAISPCTPGTGATIPLDPLLNGVTKDTTFLGTQPASESLSIWNGNISSFGNYQAIVCAKLNANGTVTSFSDGTSCNTLSVTFVVNGTAGSINSVVIALGAHLAVDADWGPSPNDPNGASQISGSPYHWRYQLVDASGTVAQGSRDRSMQLTNSPAAPPATGSIKITKVCQPTNIHLHGSFPFTVTEPAGGLLPASTTIDCASSFDATNTPADSYTVTEALPANLPNGSPNPWVLSSITCDGGSTTPPVISGDSLTGSVTINLGSNDSVSCTFTNSTSYMPLTKYIGETAPTSDSQADLLAALISGTATCDASCVGNLEKGLYLFNLYPTPTSSIYSASPIFSFNLGFSDPLLPPPATASFCEIGPWSTPVLVKDGGPVDGVPSTTASAFGTAGNSVGIQRGWQEDWYVTFTPNGGPTTIYRNASNLRAVHDSGDSLGILCVDAHVDAGDEFKLDVHNIQPGTITIKKATIGGDDTFNFTVSGGPTGTILAPAYIGDGSTGSSSTSAQASPYTAGVITSSGSGSTNVTVTAGGVYSVVEQALSGWDPTAGFTITCDDGSNTNSISPTNITIAANATVTCSFSNTKKAKLTVNKLVVNPVQSTDPGKFKLAVSDTTLGGSGGNTTVGPCTAGSTTAVSCGGLATLNFKGVVGGDTHTVAETLDNATPSFTLAGDYSPTIDCGTKSASGSAPSWNVTLNPGDNVTCNITNTRDTGYIKISKATLGDTGTFTFSASGGDGSTVTLTPSLITASTTGVAVDTGTLQVVTGSYAVTETGVTSGDATLAEWTTKNDCGNTGSGLTGLLTVTTGSPATCNYTNTKKAKVSLIKQINGVTQIPGNSGTLEWKFNLYNNVSGSLTSPLPSATASANLPLVGGIAPDYSYVDKIDLSANFAVCEMGVIAPADLTSMGVPPPYNANWTVSGATAGAPYNVVINATTGAFVSCVNFPFSPGEVVSVTVNNRTANTSPRTIGYWKNWSTCNPSNGLQVSKATALGLVTLDRALVLMPYPFGVLATEGISPNQDCSVPTVTAPTQSTPAVLPTILTNGVAEEILQKSMTNGSNMGNDAAYGMAAQLLAAEANIAAGAPSCTALTDPTTGYIVQSQTLLHGVGGSWSWTKSNTSAWTGFNDWGNYLSSATKTNATVRSNALNLGTILNNYNNGLPLSTGGTGAPNIVCQ